MRRRLLLGLAGLCLLTLVMPGRAFARRPVTRATPAHHSPTRGHRRVVHHPARRRRRRPPARRAHPPAAPIPRPLARTSPAVAVTLAAATAVGSVNPEGRLTTYAFQWGTSASYGQTTPSESVGSASAMLPVSAPVTGLSPLTTYHLRLVATDCGGCAAGTGYGQDMTFTTSGYRNPVFSATGAADPSVLDNNATHDDYWAFVTGNRFPILRSSDLVHWAPAGTAFSDLPSWVVATGNWHPWAPHVVQTTGPCPGSDQAGCYLMYYVGLSAVTHANCVAVATASSPGGPYRDQGPLSNGTLDAEGRPVGCGDDQGEGQIDPSVFVDPANGQRYLYVSEDFSCPPASSSCSVANRRLQPTISVIPLSPDGLSADGPRAPLFSGDPGGWEAAGASVPTVEGPMAVEHDGTYYLFYSGGSYRSQYAMGYATATSPLGPFTKATASPILSSTSAVIGPGGGDVPVTGPDGGHWLVYHGRDGSDANPRLLRIDPFTWVPGESGGPAVPSISGPTSLPQPTLP